MQTTAEICYFNLLGKIIFYDHAFCSILSVDLLIFNILSASYLLYGVSQLVIPIDAPVAGWFMMENPTWMIRGYPMAMETLTGGTSHVQAN